MRHREHLKLIPDHMHESVCAWIEKGFPHPTLMGGFLRAVLSNNLVEAFFTADMMNKASLQGWVYFLTTAAPERSWGSYETLLGWHADKHREPWKPLVGPRYTHDCSECTFLGCADIAGDVYDLYFCEQQSKVPTLIARVSSDPSDYVSGTGLAEFHPALAEALRRARSTGKMSSEENADARPRDA